MFCVKHEVRRHADNDRAVFLSLRTMLHQISDPDRESLMVKRRDIQRTLATALQYGFIYASPVDLSSPRSRHGGIAKLSIY